MEPPWFQCETQFVKDRKTTKIGICGDYSVTINPQLETQNQLVPLPEDLMRNL